MYKLSRFGKKNGKHDRKEIEEWAENYFFNLLNIFNAFFVHVDVEEAVARMESIPFAQLVAEQLENEDEDVLKVAMAKVQELSTIEIDFMKSYID